MKVSTHQQNIWTRLDDIGSLFGVERIKGESLADYRDRLLRAFVQKMDASSVGLNNSLLSEIGYEAIRAVKFSLKSGVTSNDYPRRAILKTDNRLIICSHFTSLDDFTIDYSIELREKPYPSLYRLCTLITINSEIYDAELLDSAVVEGYGSDSYLKIAKAFTLLNGTNRKTNRYISHPTTSITLPNKNLVKGSLLFSDNTILSNEVTGPEYLLNIPGNYYVDYEKGAIVLVTFPTRSIEIYYEYLDDDFELVHSPVIASRIFTDEAKKYLFDELNKLTYDTEATNTNPGLPKTEMIELVYSLLRVSNIYWGV